MNDEDASGPRGRFLELLAASVDFDRRTNSPQTLGYNGDRGSCRETCGCAPFRSVGSIITYSKFPLNGDPVVPPPPGGDVVIGTQGGGVIGTQDGDIIGPQP